MAAVPPLAVPMLSTALNLSQGTLAIEVDDALRLLRDLEGGCVLQLHPEGGGRPVSLPAPVVELLVRILTLMASGDAVAVMPVRAEITTQQAADLINVSRLHLIELLDRGDLIYCKVGAHRRESLTDALAYQRRDQARRKAILDALSREAQNIGLDC